METHYAAVRLMVNVGVLIRRSILLMTFNTSNTYDRTCVLLIKVLYKSVFSAVADYLQFDSSAFIFKDFMN